MTTIHTYQNRMKPGTPVYTGVFAIVTGNTGDRDKAYRTTL